MAMCQSNPNYTCYDHLLTFCVVVVIIIITIICWTYNSQVYYFVKEHLSDVGFLAKNNEKLYVAAAPTPSSYFIKGRPVFVSFLSQQQQLAMNWIGFHRKQVPKIEYISLF